MRHPDDTYACPRFVIVEHLAERLFAEDNLAQSRRSMEQMQLSVYKVSYPYMSYIQSRKLRGDSNHVSVHDPRESRVGQFVFRQPVHLLSGQCFLIFSHPFDVFRRICQMLVLLGMGGHIREG